MTTDSETSTSEDAPNEPATKRPPSKELRGRRGNRRWLWLVPPSLVAAVYVWSADPFGLRRSADSAPPEREARSGITDETLAETVQIVRSALDGGEPTVSAARFGERNHGVYVAFRRDGKLLADGWDDRRPTVGDALAGLAADLVAAEPDMRPDAAELCIAHAYRRVGNGGARHA